MYVTTRSSPLMYVTNQTSPLMYVTTRSSPLMYVTTRSSPLMYVTNQTSPLIYVTTRSSPLTYFTNQTSPLTYVTTRSSPLTYFTNQTSPLTYFTNQTSPLTVPGFPGAPSAPLPQPEWPQPGEKEHQSPLSSWRSRPAVQPPLVAERRTAAPHSVLRPDPVQTGSVQQPISMSDSSRAVRRSVSGSNLRFEAVPLDQEATEGAEVTFTCQVSSVAVAVATWLKDGGAVRTGPGLQQRQDATRLTLTMERVRQADQGTYRCQLITTEGLTVTSATWTLSVHKRRDDGVSVCAAERIQVKGRRSGQRSEVRGVCEAPCFIRRLADLKVMDGSRVTMTVELTGVPPPEVVWLHDGLEVTESEDFHLLREENRCTLMIQEVFPEDNGTYSCRAWNQNGEAQTQARLTVEEPQDGVQPWFITKPRAVSAVVGQHVLLSCAVAGDPFPQHAWTRGEPSRPLTSGGDYELLQKDDVVSLLIRRVRRHHAGDYQITLR
ncbi:myosin light chain kinase, smooth muscle-like [Sander lucioperca]|uniref:myosin light chain kinase, smooth muscle-like n=1 Tax=Sander lucioperca TaxID=283035 RepID=UPI001653865A|nr:myosin light chain kinase, smooth muscle-like [Sander lucioperca]